MQKKNHNRYIIFRIINNNVITSLDEYESEIILMGKGISYNKKIGDYVYEDSVEKVFVLKGKERARYLDIIEHIPAQYLDIAMGIIETAEHELSVKANPIGYVMLADHISSAVERAQSNIIIKNDMLSEIKHFHPEEYGIGKRALKQIEQKYGIKLPLDEAGFIAFHLINLAETSHHKESDDRQKLIENILLIIENYFTLKLDEDSIYYERFLTHLKYFSSRVFSKEESDLINVEKDDFLFRMMSIQYPETTKCVELVQEYLNYNYHVSVSNEEKGYLIIHINNLLHKAR